MGLVGERDVNRRNASYYLISATRFFTIILCSRTLNSSSMSYGMPSQASTCVELNPDVSSYGMSFN